MPKLPTGTVTFLFTDIEGSTRLLEELGEGFRALQDAHSTILREAVSQHGGVEIRTEGDSFFVVFETPGAAVRAVADAQRGLDRHSWPPGHALRVRMGMHTGNAVLGGDDYLGLDVNRAARIAAVGWGGQVVISDALRGLVEQDVPEGVAIRSLGVHRLKDLTHPEHLFQLVVGGLPTDFPPLRTDGGVPTDLPLLLTSFVGRPEVDEVAGAALEGTGCSPSPAPGARERRGCRCRPRWRSRTDSPMGWSLWTCSFALGAGPRAFGAGNGSLARAVAGVS